MINIEFNVKLEYNLQKKQQKESATHKIQDVKN